MGEGVYTIGVTVSVVGRILAVLTGVIVARGLVTSTQPAIVPTRTEIPMMAKATCLSMDSQLLRCPSGAGVGQASI